MLFNDVHSCEDKDELTDFKYEILNAMDLADKRGESILRESLRNELRKVENRIDYLMHKDIPVNL